MKLVTQREFDRMWEKKWKDIKFRLKMRTLKLSLEEVRERWEKNEKREPKA